MKKKLSGILTFIFIVICIWTSITCMIQRFKCPVMTDTELFLYIPQSFVCNWKICN
jgi:hypothetical protein